MEKNTAPPPYSAYPSSPLYPNQPPPPGFIPPTQTHHTVTTVLVTPQSFGPDSQTVTCAHCRHDVRTRLETETTSRTHLYALLLCLFGCWPCAIIPYCLDSCKNISHYCPNCKAFLGTYQN